jgi:hypothetical protein
MELEEEKNEVKKDEWTDQFVEVDATRPELKRFAGSVGRVVTVNCNNKAVVDFADGAWYDITTDYLRKVDAATGKPAYEKGKLKNSAQPFPERQS